MKNEKINFTQFVETGYDTIACAYHDSKDPMHNMDLLERLGCLLPAKSEVLDVGCGAGVPNAKYLSDQGHSVTGIDISSKMLELARKNVPSGKFVGK